jgi:hypothetical protein
MYARIWKDNYHGGWFFKYWRPNDREWTEDGPFKTFENAEVALMGELEELFIETEGTSELGYEVGRER